jgi:hypothetical protein
MADDTFMEGFKAAFPYKDRTTIPYFPKKGKQNPGP